jgi:hypothetical protein
MTDRNTVDASITIQKNTIPPSPISVHDSSVTMQHSRRQGINPVNVLMIRTSNRIRPFPPLSIIFQQSCDGSQTQELTWARKKHGWHTNLVMDPKRQQSITHPSQFANHDSPTISYLSRKSATTSSASFWIVN